MWAVPNCCGAEVDRIVGKYLTGQGGGSTGVGERPVLGVERYPMSTARGNKFLAGGFEGAQARTDVKGHSKPIKLVTQHSSVEGKVVRNQNRTVNPARQCSDWTCPVSVDT